MAAATHNFSIEQGSDNQIIFEYMDENNQLVNLSNYHVSMTCVTNNGILFRFNNFTKTTDYMMTTTTSGRIILDIPSKTTNLYNFNTAVYDLDIQEPNEQYTGSGLKKYRFAQGTITLIKRNTSINTSDIMEPITEHLSKCQLDCSALDSVIYDGNRIDIPDNHKIVSSIFVSDHRPIESVDVVINGLYHRNPQDLTMFLTPPSGNKVLLFAHQKIINYEPGFSFSLSDYAPSGHYVNNAFNGDSCRILNKVNSIRYDNGSSSTSSTSNEVLNSSFDHLINYVPSSGNWSLEIFDNDIGSPGVIDDWKLLIKYQDNTPLD